MGDPPNFHVKGTSYTNHFLKCDFTRKTAGQGARTRISLLYRLIGKRVVDFLLVLIERFRWMLRLRCYERMSVQNRRFRFNGGGAVDPKFQVEGFASSNHSSSQKTRLNDLSYGIKIWTELSSVLSQSTRLTDGRTAGRQLSSDYIVLHLMQRGKNALQRKANLNYVTRWVIKCSRVWA